MKLVRYFGEDDRQTRFLGLTARRLEDKLFDFLTQELVDTSICTFNSNTGVMRVNPGKTAAFRQKETEILNLVSDAGSTPAKIVVALIRWLQRRRQ